MDGSSSPPPNSCPTTTTSKSLCNLPSRGLFSSTSLFSNPGGIRVYVCDHDTAPPEDQLIKTNQTNILIRSLKKEKNESSLKDVKDPSARKRGADKTLDGRSKRAMTEGSSNDSSPGMNFHSLTVERLRALLKEKGLSLRGKKDELVARLRNG